MKKHVQFKFETENNIFFYVKFQSKIPTQIVHSLVNQQQDTLRELIEDFEEKEKLRLEECLLTESGQQQLAIRTYKVQLNQQNQRIDLLQKQIEHSKQIKDEKKALAVEFKQQHEQLNDELEQITQQAKQIDPKLLERVETLVAEYETIKKLESETRSKYKGEKAQLDDEISQLEQRLQTSELDPTTNSEEYEKFKQIEEQYQLVENRLQKQKLILVNNSNKIRFSFLLFSW